ncbi:MAG: NUDIX domain-containing protein [Bacteroidales bacterium]|nr:NUDIX domain-containing protein [Bacteroidales bacterium]
MQKYNLFFNEAVFTVIIYDKNEINNLVSTGKIIYEDRLCLDTLVEKFLHRQENVQVYVAAEKEANLFKKLTAYFCYQKTAGGVVTNTEGNILVMLRYDNYDFPKGHIEEGESMEEAALREVREETNVKDLLLGEKIGISYHVFYARERYYLKENHWFKMISRGNETLIPQREEHIDALSWCSPEEIKNKLSKFYPSLQEMILTKVLV